MEQEVLQYQRENRHLQGLVCLIDETFHRIEL